MRGFLFQLRFLVMYRMYGMPRVQGRHTGRISVARGQESVVTAQERRLYIVKNRY